MKLLCLAIKNKYDKINYIFENSCKKYNIKYDIIQIYNKKYKYDQILKYIEYLDENYILLVVNYSSTLIVNYEKEIINTFLKTDIPYIFSQENEIDNLINYTKKYYKNDPQFCFSDGIISFPSIECFIGFKDDLLDIITKINDYKSKKIKNENTILNNLCNYGYKINVDNNNKFFFNSNNNKLFNENISINNNNLIIKKTFLTNINKISKPLVLCNFNYNNVNNIWNSIDKSKNLIVISNDKYVIYSFIIIVLIILIVLILKLNI
jgi:hypothetical protein